MMLDPFLPMRVAQSCAAVMLQGAAATTAAIAQSVDTWSRVSGVAAEQGARAGQSSTVTAARALENNALSLPWMLPAEPKAPARQPMAGLAPWDVWKSCFAWMSDASRHDAPVGWLAPGMSALQLMPGHSVAPLAFPGVLPGMFPNMFGNWPMAAGMMAWGVPSNVAWPAAEAGRTMMEASRQSIDAAEEAFSAYRTDGGHATAQIVFKRPERILSAVVAVPPAMIALQLALMDWAATGGSSLA